MSAETGRIPSALATRFRPPVLASYRAASAAARRVGGVRRCDPEVRGSIGVSTGTDWPADAMMLMRRADLALYESKRADGAGPYFFRDQLQERSDRRRIIEAAGFPPERLVIEITETALLRDTITATRVIDELHAMGTRVALDDFGAGFASIGYLKLIRFDLIKIDEGLVRSIDECALARQLLAGVVQLCRAIGTPIVVEQVESDAQMAIVALLGADKVQGYLTGRPAAEPCFDSGWQRLEDETPPFVGGEPDLLVQRVA